VEEEVVDCSFLPSPQILAEETQMEKEMDEDRKRALGVIATIFRGS
jgi:hypothetical protein